MNGTRENEIGWGRNNQFPTTTTSSLFISRSIANSLSLQENDSVFLELVMEYYLIILFYFSSSFLYPSYCTTNWYYFIFPFYLAHINKYRSGILRKMKWRIITRNPTVTSAIKRSITIIDDHFVYQFINNQQ